MTSPARRALAVATVMAVAGGALLAQSRPPQAQQRPTFRGGVELVQVDVVVLDEQGRPVRGLTADDFTILDRRKPQEIATFAELAHVREDDGLPRPPADVPMDVADNQATTERVVFLVIDDLNIWRSRDDRVKKAARKVVDGLGPDASLAVLFTSGRDSIEVTADRARVLDAIETLDAPNFFFRSGRNELGGTCTPQDIQGCYVLKTIEDAARAVGSGDLRRKAMIVISEWNGHDVRGLYELMRERFPVVGSGMGYATTGDPEALPGAVPVPYQDFALLDMMHSLRRANVTFYGLDPRQYEPTDEEIRREHLCAKGATNTLCGGYAEQFALKLTAEATGGFALIDRDTFDAGLARIVTDLDNYYLLGFYPENPDDRDWHPLAVTVNRPGVSVRHRVGYRLGGEPEAPKNEDPLVALSAGVLPEAGLPLRLFATPVARSGEETRLAVALEMRAPAAALERPDGRLEDRVVLTVLAADLDRKRVVRSARHEVDVIVPRSRVLADGQASYQVVFGLDLPAGSYQVRVSAESARLDSGGSVYLMADVPDPDEDVVVIAGPVIGFAPGGRRAASLSLVEDGLLPPGLDPVTARIFTPADTLRVHYDVWRRSDRGTMPTRLEVLNERGEPVFAWQGTVPDRGTGPYDVEIPLAGLPPGAYRVKITAGAGDTMTERVVGFAVRSER